MRLALVTHRLVNGDGQGRVNSEIARRALERGHRVTLVASEVMPELRQHPAAVWAPIPVAGWPTEAGRNQAFAARSARWLRRNRAALDVVHVNGGLTWEPGDVNAAHFVHGAWRHSPVHTARVRRDVYGAYQWVYTVLNCVWERRAYRQARRVVAVSERVRQELVGIGVSPERIRVILNGVDLEEFHPGAADRDVLGLPQGVPLTLFAGEIRTPRKNLETVLRALTLVPGGHLVVVGATEGSPYPALAAELGVADRVHFMGYRRDVAQVMRASDLFVFPSRYEACSLVLLEALASGLPVISARTAGGSEVITPGAGVVLADPEDVQGLAGALSRLLGGSPLTAARRAARAAVVRHGWAEMADRYLELYAETMRLEGDCC